MTGSISSIASLSTLLQQQQTTQQLDVAVLNKAQDIQKQQGEAVLKLLESSQASGPSIDVYA